MCLCVPMLNSLLLLPSEFSSPSFVVHKQSQCTESKHKKETKPTEEGKDRKFLSIRQTASCDHQDKAWRECERDVMIESRPWL